MDDAKVEPLVPMPEVAGRVKTFRELVSNADDYRGQRPRPIDHEITMGGRSYRYWSDGSLRRA